MADIGSLVVKLAAETAEFQADLGKSARLLDKHANEMKASLQSVANVAKSAFALAVGVTSVAAIKEFVLQTMEAAAALQGLSEQTGASVEALSGFQAVATISHTTLENIGGSLAKLAKGMAGVDDETAGATKALQLLRLCHEKITAHQVSQFKIWDGFNQLVDGVERLIIFTLGDFQQALGEQGFG
mgnify:CR=1 FL=1